MPSCKLVLIGMSAAIFLVMMRFRSKAICPCSKSKLTFQRFFADLLIFLLHGNKFIDLFVIEVLAECSFSLCYLDIKTSGLRGECAIDVLSGVFLLFILVEVSILVSFSFVMFIFIFVMFFEIFLHDREGTFFYFSDFQTFLAKRFILAKKADTEE